MHEHFFNDYLYLIRNTVKSAACLFSEMLLSLQESNQINGDIIFYKQFFFGQFEFCITFIIISQV